MSVFLVLACHIESWKMGLETLLEDHYTVPKYINISYRVSLFFLFFVVLTITLTVEPWASIVVIQLMTMWKWMKAKKVIPI